MDILSENIMQKILVGGTDGKSNTGSNDVSNTVVRGAVIAGKGYVSIFIGIFVFFFILLGIIILGAAIARALGYGGNGNEDDNNTRSRPTSR